MAVAASHVALRDLGLELRECSRMDEAADIFALRSRVSMIEFEDHQIVDPTVDARVSTEVFADERPMTGTDIRVASSRPREVGRTVELVVLAPYSRQQGRQYERRVPRARSLTGNTSIGFSIWQRAQTRVSAATGST